MERYHRLSIAHPNTIDSWLLPLVTEFDKVDMKFMAKFQSVYIHFGFIPIKEVDGSSTSGLCSETKNEALLVLKYDGRKNEERQLAHEDREEVQGYGLS